jgi:hypothetical protein
MARIINDRPGDVVQGVNDPVAASTTVRAGDLVKYSGTTGNLVPAAVGDAALLGVAASGLTTGATPNFTRDRVVVETFTAEGRYRGTLKNATTLDRTLIGQAAGFIDEGGEIRIDTAATVKQAIIVDIVERPFATNDPKEVKFQIPLSTNRVR